MKILLKLFLILCLVLAGIYAATPLWLPKILARQLPTGWQLEELQSGYPGLTGINVDLLRVKGGLGNTGLELTSSDLRFGYQGLKTDIAQVSLDIYIGGAENRSADPLTLDDLSLPVTKLTGKLPRLSVDQVQLTLYRTIGVHTAQDKFVRPVKVDFEAFDLNPRSDDSFHIMSQVIIADSMRFKGRLDVDVSPDSFNATINFPSSTDLPPWLVVEMTQEDLPATTTTHVKAVLKAGLANREWLDSLLAGNTGHMLTQLGGNIEIGASFAGQSLQKLETLSVTSENLRLVSDSGTMDITANALAHREGDKIAVTVPEPAKMRFQGKTEWIDQLLNEAVPALRLTPRSELVISSELGSNSRFSFQIDKGPFMRFNGDIDLDLKSDAEHLTLHSTGLKIEVEDPDNLESTTAEGLVAFGWAVNAPVAYTLDDVQLTADKLTIAAELISKDGKFISTGNGSFIQARLTSPAVSAEKVDLTWRQLDIEKLTGNLDTRTQGFSANFNDETWNGFDFDISYVLLSNFDVNGSGNLKFSSGPELPLEFTGNTDSQRWDINLPPATVQLSKLRKLLAVAHVQMPAAIKLKDGYIELQGNILVDDDITASMDIAGFGMHALMHESSALDASFTFNTGYDSKLRANGPLSIGVLALAGGIDVANIRSELELESVEHFELKDLYAEVFEGQLVLGSLQFSENKIAETTVELSHISLSRLLAFAEINGLEGTGFLDISLPLGSDEVGIHVNNGTFRATAPGRLAYKNQGISSSNIGLQAMENFQYKDLSGTLNYQSDGTYLISIRLEGKNPDLYGGHPVVFNLNINGLLPALFESMFITGSFEESILKEIKSKQKPKEAP